MEIMESLHTKTAWLGEFPAHWEVLRIKNIATINDEALSEKTETGFLIKYIDIGNVNSSEEINEIQEFKFSDAPSRARRILRKGDVVISTVRTYLKAITQISFEVDNHIASKGFAILKPKKNITSDFLSFAVRAKYFIASIMANSFGVSYPAINSSTLAPLPILIPRNTAGKLNETQSKDFEKVQFDDDEYVFVDKDQYDELTSEDLVVDIVKGRKMLTNASCFAFTATPKNKTLEAAKCVSRNYKTSRKLRITA